MSWMVAQQGISMWRHIVMGSRLYVLWCHNCKGRLVVSMVDLLQWMSLCLPHYNTRFPVGGAHCINIVVMNSKVTHFFTYCWVSCPTLQLGYKDSSMSIFQVHPGCMHPNLSFPNKLLKMNLANASPSPIAMWGMTHYPCLLCLVDLDEVENGRQITV
jgi:hypothetical protein